MNDDATKGIIILAVVLTTTTAYIRHVRQGTVEFRTFLAGGFLGAFLFGIAVVSERLARNLAVLVIMVALLQNGPAAFDFAATQANPKKRKGGR